MAGHYGSRLKKSLLYRSVVLQRRGLGHFGSRIVLLYDPPYSSTISP